MALDREVIFAALFARLAAVDGFVYSSRIWKGFDDLESNVEQPALILIKGNETQVSPARGMPLAWKLSAVALIAARVTEADPTVAPSTTINELLTLVEAALERQPDEVPNAAAIFFQNPDMMQGTTLGGLCTSCRIEGDIVTDEGALGLQGYAAVPISIHTATVPT